MSVAGAEWVSVAVVAARLRVTPRAVQKRCAKGTLPARRVEGERGEVWEVAASVLSANPTANSEPQSANHEREPRANTNTVRSAQRRSPAIKQGESHSEQEREPRTFESERERELKEEVRFLRGLVEQHQRSEAELRASLREALKAMPKQLATGETGSPTTTPETARIDLEREQNATATYEAPKPPDPRIPRTGDDGGVSYGDIADAIEKELLNR
jgi:hypothetical protein